MNLLYTSIGISKQAFHQMMNRVFKQRSEQQQMLVLICQIRHDHPTMGLRDMYYKLNPETMGRDVFESFCRDQGLSSRKKRNFRKTTDSRGVSRFNNLLKDTNVTGINQVWQSDITYYEVNGRFCYITLIEDAYSRRIIGYSVSKRLSTEQTTIPALKMAIKARKKEGQSIEGLIFHSDGGGQYYDKEFLELTDNAGIRNSMCLYPWENGKVERLNGVIKNNYLRHRNIVNFRDLNKEVDRSVFLYNNEKPHIALGRKTPIQFEKYYLCNGQQSEGEKSATDIKTKNQRDLSVLRTEDNNPSGSNIAQDLKTFLLEKQKKTVNIV
jgi:putative transposase